MSKFVLHRNTTAVRIVTDKKLGTLLPGAYWFFHDSDRSVWVCNVSRAGGAHDRWITPVGTLRAIAESAAEPVKQYDKQGFLIS